ncbi:MAG: RusA family crossover junction endodeoxyribonuclease [Myxococcales bacterium]|nr:RusA family crossover junction endodeoxyribonuclease [Myxococcales bacterium]
MTTRRRAATAGKGAIRTVNHAADPAVGTGRATASEARLAPPVVFFVEGTAKTKGSFVPIPTADGVVVKRSSKGGAAWERAVRRAAWVAYRKAGLEVSADAPAIGKGRPVAVSALFVLPRPKYHLDRSGAVREEYIAAVPVVLRDGDKLLRAVFDGLTGAAYVDDGQVTNWQGAKVFAVGGEPVGAYVSVRDARRPLVGGLERSARLAAQVGAAARGV